MLLDTHTHIRSQAQNHTLTHHNTHIYTYTHTFSFYFSLSLSLSLSLSHSFALPPSLRQWPPTHQAPSPHFYIAVPLVHGAAGAGRPPLLPLLLRLSGASPLSSLSPRSCRQCPRPLLRSSACIPAQCLLGTDRIERAREEKRDVCLRARVCVCVC